ncbi:MAG: class I SAM-dependent methyltransferase [Clostridia bacterium]|nr:class I SAM-dependent methyltransferase [Clostridia bacterium]
MSYDSFSKYYDILMADADYPARAEYYHKLLSENGAASGILLDLGCGTGEMSLLMDSFGYEVIGVDSSVEMLNIARNKTAGRDILLLNQPMEELDLYGTVDCAISALDCINHLDGKETVKESFSKVSLFMNPGGVFVFDVNTVYKHREILADNCFITENDNLFCAWQNSLNDDDGVDISLDFFEKSGDKYIRSSEFFTEYAYETDDIKSMLDEAGFEIIGEYDDMSFEPVKADSERAVFAARKR